MSYSELEIEVEVHRMSLAVPIQNRPQQTLRQVDNSDRTILRQTSNEAIYGSRSQFLDTDAAALRTNSQEFVEGVRQINVQSAFYYLTKRIMDIAISLAAIIVLAPLFLVVAVMIKWHDRGTVFFSQERVGKEGRTFRCYKFRSMTPNAEALQQRLMVKNQHSDPRTFKMSNDPRVTSLGKVLRRYSIDEFPQIFNVMMGDMSLVGPRPPLPRETQLYSRFDLQRLAVKPGLTCIWQISGRSRLPFPEQVKLDLEYIRHQSLMLDFGIILRTIPAVFNGEGV